MVSIDCQQCKGTGKRPLAPALSEALEAVVQAGRPITGAELGPILGIMPSAACNRLAILKRYGLLTYRDDGRRKFYTARGKAK